MSCPIKYRNLKPYKYQLMEGFDVDISEEFGTNDQAETEFLMLNNGHLAIKRLYCSDGPSGPTVDTPSFMRGSFVHDALYSLLRMKLLDPAQRILADKVLHRLCREDGMSRFRAWYVYRSVRVFGGFAA